MALIGFPTTFSLGTGSTYLASNAGTGSIYTYASGAGLRLGIESYTTGTVVWTPDPASASLVSSMTYPTGGEVRVMLVPTGTYRQGPGLLIMRATVNGVPTTNQAEITIADTTAPPFYYSAGTWISAPLSTGVFWTDLVGTRES